MFSFKKNSADYWVIAGLGNPGAKYAKTRHNAGFMAVDYLAQKHNISITKKTRGTFYGKGPINGAGVFLIKPQAYMNLSGEGILAFLSFYQIKTERLIVVYDNCDLPAGTARFKRKGTNSAHNGIKNITQVLKTNEFKRVSIGAGPRPPEIPLTDYCLSAFDVEREKDFLNGVQKAAEILEDAVKKGFSF